MIWRLFQSGQPLPPGAPIVAERNRANKAADGNGRTISFSLFSSISLLMRERSGVRVIASHGLPSAHAIRPESPLTLNAAPEVEGVNEGTPPDAGRVIAFEISELGTSAKAGIQGFQVVAVFGLGRTFGHLPGVICRISDCWIPAFAVMTILSASRPDSYFQMPLPGEWSRAF